MTLVPSSELLSQKAMSKGTDPCSAAQGEAWADSLKTNDFDFQALLDFVFALEKPVDGIEGPRVVVALSACPANLGLDVFHDIKLAVKPVVLAHFLGDGFATTKLAVHSSSFSSERRP
jgi:hypothetical protein